VPLQWPEVRAAILENHPLAVSAGLLDRQAAAALLRAKGGFDPKIYTHYYAKDFKGKHYYSYTDAGAKLPVWGGLELKGSYNLARGNYLNEESELPTIGQAALGFRWTLGQGLLMDERRADLRQARIGIAQNKADQEGILNDLVYEAAKSYWSWVLYDNQLIVTRDALNQALIRLNGLRESYLQGDKPAIDTLEAFIQVQARQLDLNFAQVDAQNAKIGLQYFFWQNRLGPSDTSAIQYAPFLPLDKYVNRLSPDSLIADALARHPDLRYLDADLQILDIERRLKAEKLRPVFDLHYNALGSGWSFFPTQGFNGPAALVTDNKWGFDFIYPIPNRKARGDVQLAGLKMDRTRLKILEKRQAVENKVRQYYNDLQTLARQINTYRSMVENYKTLLNAENTRFFIGESSIFLVNSREQKWLESQIKYLKLLSDYRKTEAALTWAAGVR
jgi:outer membrane protein TolC